MILDTTTKSLELLLGSVVTTTAMPITVDYVDSTSTTFTPGSVDAQSNGTSTVTILAAPSASTQRKVNALTVYNADSAAKLTTVRINNNTTLRPLVVITLQVGDTLGYTDVSGWYVMDSTGAIKGVGPTGATGATGANGTNGATGMPGLDGEDGQDGIPMPGPQGISGTAGGTGPQGPIGWGLPGEDGEDALHIPGPVGPTGATGAAGSGGAYGTMVTGGCTQTTGALTFTMPSLSMDFRSTTLTSGTITTVTGTPADLVLPSGGTLGSVTTVSARIVRVIINNAGTLEQAIVNISGGNDLSETGTINTTAIDTASDSANVFYSTTARTNVAYKVVGAVDAVNTAGAWGNPTLVQGAGGNALTAMSSLGYGQTWQDVTGSRAVTTTYYNTTGRSIFWSLCATMANGSPASLTINGVSTNLTSAFTTNAQSQGTFIVPPGGSYSLSSTNVSSIFKWLELR